MPAAGDARGPEHDQAAPGWLELPRRVDWSRMATAAGPRAAVQPKLRINAPGDRFEEEADRIAEEVVRVSGSSSESTPHDTGRPAPSGASLPESGPGIESRGTVARASIPASVPAVTPISRSAMGGAIAPPTVEALLETSGAHIEPEVRTRMEEVIGRRFDDVMIHVGGPAGDSADEIGARAYTVGRRIVFADGEYRPGTVEGERLLAHELVHVVQQSGASATGGSDAVLQRDPDPRTPKQGDIPGERPSSISDGDEWQIRIDADGNQHKELLLLLKQVDAPEGFSKSTYLGLQVTIQHVGYSESKGVIFPVRRRPGRDGFHRIVTQMTDGKIDTIIALMTEGKPELRIPPPVKQSKDVLYTLVLENPEGTEVGSPKETVKDYQVGLSLPDVRKKRDDVFQPGAPQGEFGISTLDVTIGAYKDRFRIVTRPWGENGLLFGLVPYEELTPVDPTATPSPGVKPEDPGKGEDAAAGQKPAPEVVESINRGLGVYLSFPQKPFEGGTAPGGEELVRGKGISIVGSDGVSISLDLDGDGVADVTLYDLMELHGKINPIQPTPDKLDRTHTIRISGPAAGADKELKFKREYNTTMREGSEDSKADKYTNAYALGVRTLSEQQQEGTTADQQAQIDSYERKVRYDAVQAKLITQRTYDAWLALDRDLTQIRLQVSDPNNQPVSSDPAKDARQVDQGLVDRAATGAKELYEALSAETANEPLEMDGLLGLRNKYTDATTITTTSGMGYPFVGSTTTTTGSGPGLESTIRSDAAGHWEDAFRKYEMLASGLDLWISKKRMEGYDKAGAAGREQIDHEKMVAIRQRDIAEMAKEAGGEPKRILATYIPDPDLKYEESEKLDHAREIPLALYYWGTEDTWYIEDLTSPGRRYHHTVAREPGETVPGGRLLQTMNDAYHYPEGIITYSIPGGQSGSVQLEDHVTWRDFVEWLQIAAIGLAVVGATLSGLEFAVPALWAMGASIVAQTASATVDLVGKSQSGELTATNALIDVGLIVSGLAGMAELATGRIVVEASNAAKIGKPFQGANAEYAMLAQRIYLPVKAARMGADIFTLATVTVEVAGQLDAIENGPGSDQEKKRAKMILLSTLAINGGLIGLSIKGDLPQFRANRELRLYFPLKDELGNVTILDKEGNPTGLPTALLSGMEAPGNLRFSQESVNWMTGDGKMNIEELSGAIKQKWDGQPVDVVEWGPGDLSSYDNRRLDAALEAGVAEIPVIYHQPGESFHPDRGEHIELDRDIFLINGEYVTGKFPGQTPVYKKKATPTTWGEAIMFRSANQRKFRSGSLKGEPFPVRGTTQRPFVNIPEGSSYRSGR